MNLPAKAVEFLDAFKACRYNPALESIRPLISVYLFSVGEDTEGESPGYKCQLVCRCCALSHKLAVCAVASVQSACAQSLVTAFVLLTSFSSMYDQYVRQS